MKRALFIILGTVWQHSFATIGDTPFTTSTQLNILQCTGKTSHITGTTKIDGLQDGILSSIKDSTEISSCTPASPAASPEVCYNINNKLKNGFVLDLKTPSYHIEGNVDAIPQILEQKKGKVIPFEACLTQTFKGVTELSPKELHGPFMLNILNLRIANH
jgi:hypothetical protein